MGTLHLCSLRVLCGSGVWGRGGYTRPFLAVPLDHSILLILQVGRMEKQPFPALSTALPRAAWLGRHGTCSRGLTTGLDLSSLLTALNTALLLPINQPVKDLFKVSELQKGLLISRTNKTTRMFVLFFQSFQSLVSSVGKFLVGGSCTDRCNNGSWEPKI